MLFNSYLFIFIFLPLSVFGFYFLSRYKNSRILVNFLLIISIIFYSIGNFQDLPLIIFSVLINFILGKIIFNSNNPQKTYILILGLAFNLLILFYFKYSVFLILDLLNIFSLDETLAVYKEQIPLGISIYTFTQIGYLVDSYSRSTSKSNFSSYALFVTLFPHILAGPIIHHKKIIDQFNEKEFLNLNSNNIISGLFLFVIGLSKKLLIADNLAIIADPIFLNPNDYGIIASWIGSFAYTFQLYFDFSGYSDMAIGLAIMFNIKLPLNFNSPYKAYSLIDFWKRWHMTLSQFLKDYLYIPLGGNRFGTLRKYSNIFITMFLGGIWHGANLTFLFWGAIHGIGIIFNHLTKKYFIGLPKYFSIFITFIFVNLAWVMFRSNNYNDAITIYKNLFDLNSYNINELSYAIIFLLLIAIIAFFAPNSQNMLKQFKTKIVNALALSGLLLANIISINIYSPFLYFAF